MKDAARHRSRGFCGCCIWQPEIEMGGLVSRGACLAVGLMAGGLAGPAMAQEAVDWTGFYAGVFAGYGLDTAIATSTTMAPVTVENNPGEFLTIGNSDYNERFQALFGGLQVGYNYQFDNFVFGVEGALPWAASTRRAGAILCSIRSTAPILRTSLLMSAPNFLLTG
jgi:hypothetical protein